MPELRLDEKSSSHWQAEPKLPADYPSYEHLLLRQRRSPHGAHSYGSLIPANALSAGDGLLSKSRLFRNDGPMYSPSIMMTATEAIAHGRKARNEGNVLAALEHYAEAARIYRDQKDILAYAHTIRHIADIYRQEDHFIEAKPLYEEALEVYRSHLDTKLLDLANTVRPYALLLEEEGDLTAARRLWEEAKHLYGSLRINEGVSECETHIGKLQQP